MSNRVLLAVTEVPTIGGSSTAAYDLFRRLQRDGMDVHFAILIDRDDVDYVRYRFGPDPGNPNGLPDVWPLELNALLNDPHPELDDLLGRIAPDVAIGFGYLATLMLTRAQPTPRVMYVTGNCRQAQDYVTSGQMPDVVTLQSALERGTMEPAIVYDVERKAIEQSELTVTHSELTRDLLQRFFPRSIGKIYPDVISFAEWICDGAVPWRHHAREFGARDIDVLFIAAEWGRAEKNYEGVEAIASNLGNARIHIIGDVPRQIPNAVHHGFLESREALFELMGRARCVACPSRIDAAPGILFEASVLGCSIVASRNCGNWEICHPDLLSESLDPKIFAACCRRAIERKYEDRLDHLLSRGSYRELVSIIDAFQHPFASIPAS